MNEHIRDTESNRHRGCTTARTTVPRASDSALHSRSRSEAADERQDAVVQEQSTVARLISQGQYLYSCGKASDALHRFEQALPLAVRSGNGRTTADIRQGMAACSLSTGDTVRALELYLQALEWYERHGDHRNIATCYNGLGLCYKTLGHYEKALAALFYALPVLEHEHPRLYANALNSLGSVYVHLGKGEQALDYYGRSLVLFRLADDRANTVAALLNIASAYRSMELYSHALDAVTAVLALCDPEHDSLHYTTALALAGGIYKDMEDYSAALDYERKSLELARESGDRHLLLNIYACLGEIHLRLGDYDSAVEVFSQALPIAEEIDALHARSELHEYLAEAYEGMGKYKTALAHFRTGSALHRELQNSARLKAIAEMQTLFDVEKAREEARLHRQNNEEISRAYRALEEKNTELSDSNRRLTELNREKNEFLSVVAHDLKNPLGQILGLAQLIRDDRSLSQPDITDMSNDIVSSSERMFSLITNLLDINAIEQGRLNVAPSEFDLGDLLLRVVDAYRFRASLKTIHIHYTPPDDPVQAYADPSLTMQVLDNLLSNAVKYSPHNTTVHVGAYTAEPADPAQSDEASAQQVCVYVRDQGPGIGEEDRKRLFGKFARLSAHPTGGEHSTGLGLFIAHKLTEAMNGAIRCDSTQGRGTTFTVELPAADSC